MSERHNPFCDTLNRLVASNSGRMSLAGGRACVHVMRYSRRRRIADEGLSRARSAPSDVIFAISPEEAIAQATERGLEGGWEAPNAVEAPLPRGYRLAYDPLAAAEQPELPLPPRTLLPSGRHAR